MTLDNSFTLWFMNTLLTLKEETGAFEKYRRRTIENIRRMKNPTAHRASVKKWEIKNPLRKKKNWKQWADKNKEYLHARDRDRQGWGLWKASKSIEFLREYYARWARHRRHTDPEYRLLCNLRGRIWKAIIGSEKHALELLGCSVQEFRVHLEAQFTDGMTWENYGTHWEIDHKRPCVSFDLSKVEEQKGCFHFSNTQPLSVIGNRSKGAKWNG